jgi:hypothetical protein
MNYCTVIKEHKFVNTRSVLFVSKSLTAAGSAAVTKNTKITDVCNSRHILVIEGKSVTNNYASKASDPSNSSDALNSSDTNNRNDASNNSDTRGSKEARSRS